MLITFSSSGSAQEQIEHPSLLGSWEGPLVLGRDNMNLAFTFAMKEGEYTAALISGGLQAGDLIVTSGLSRLSAGQTVNIQLQNQGQ